MSPEDVPCASRDERPDDSFEAIVSAYIRDYRQRAGRELRFFKAQRSLPDVVSRAAMCELPSGKRHPHQYRIPRESLEEARRRLLGTDLAGCQSFDELHDRIEETIGDIHMVGPLVTYDIAHRIGAYIELEPTRVYLHSGTRDGARTLGLGRGRKTLEVSELPRAFHRLSAAENEDCLCIYKREIGAAARLSGVERQ